MKWPKCKIETSGGKKEAIAPQIISASRSTDIPAFYGDGFMQRLQAGWCKWVNPFNNQPQYVSFERTRAFVFWTKNAKPMLQHLDELDRHGATYYFQFTVNDYEAEKLEPGVPPLAERIETFRQLSERLGRKRVIWRFDPLMLTDKLDVANLVERVVRVGEALRDHTEKLVFSFADIGVYAKVRNNLKRCGVQGREFGRDEMLDFAEKLANATRGWGIRLATCGEMVDLEQFKIEHNRCIDDDLLMELAPKDEELRLFLRGPVDMFGEPVKTPNLKDKGQRKACGCIFSKDIGMYNTCRHLCVYCYANTSEKAVTSSCVRLADEPETIIGANQNSN